MKCTFLWSPNSGSYVIYLYTTQNPRWWQNVNEPWHARGKNFPIFNSSKLSEPLPHSPAKTFSSFHNLYCWEVTPLVLVGLSFGIHFLAPGESRPSWNNGDQSKKTNWYFWYNHDCVGTCWVATEQTSGDGRGLPENRDIFLDVGINQRLISNEH